MKVRDPMDAMPLVLRATVPMRDLGALLRRSQPPGWVADAVLATGFLVALGLERVNSASQIGDRWPLSALLVVVIAGAVAARRRAPLTAFLVSTGAMLIEARYVVVSAVTPNANLVNVYALGLYATRPRAWVGPFVIVAGNVVYFTSIDSFSPANVISPLILWLLVWAFAYGTARRQEERAAARLVLRDRVVADERAHIARELHDLVGHSLNVMLVQAGAARRVLDRDPEQTRGLLTSLQSTGREAFDELDRVLGLLRPRLGAGDGLGVGPPDTQALHPGLADLSRLTERIGQAGIRITMHIDAAAHRDSPQHRHVRLSHRPGGSDEHGEARPSRLRGREDRSPGAGPRHRGVRRRARRRRRVCHRAGAARHQRAGLDLRWQRGARGR